ncbi:hypothetical protein E2562_011103 [Oryza meyeriana var. granulata]|uniref:Uncharacterized protein n=1 Tax=Oryza meyeriana var. granulata TaxID=110450 RepID=A0A6G1EWQ9_9ORYZ|nr:hypothetical protein E2562_011103 [Oryza meyeriana var. granulata]
MDETMMEFIDNMQENRVAQSNIVVGVLMHMNRKAANTRMLQWQPPSLAFSLTSYIGYADGTSSTSMPML